MLIYFKIIFKLVLYVGTAWGLRWLRRYFVQYWNDTLARHKFLNLFISFNALCILHLFFFLIIHIAVEYSVAHLSLLPFLYILIGNLLVWGFFSCSHVLLFILLNSRNFLVNIFSVISSFSLFYFLFTMASIQILTLYFCSPIS